MTITKGVLEGDNIGNYLEVILRKLLRKMWPQNNLSQL